MTETMTELLTRARTEVDNGLHSDETLPIAVARWLKDNHPAFEEPPLSFGEHATTVWLETGEVEPADPTEWVHKRNHYFTQLIWSSNGRP